MLLRVGHVPCRASYTSSQGPLRRLALRGARVPPGVISRTARLLSDGSKVDKAVEEQPIIYSGPQARVFRYLKIFSLSSFALAACVTPFFFVIEAQHSVAARAALAGTALLASGVSTGLVTWAGASYVTSIRRTGDKSLELETSDFWLRPLRTAVWDSGVLKASGRPFSSWELPDVVVGAGATEGEVKELARTVDWKGNLRGTWLAEYRRDATGNVIGTCRSQGSVVRNFNVDEGSVQS